MSRLLGAWKTAARRSGMPFAVYAARRLGGERFCFVCRSWGPATAFPLDRTTANRKDGRKAVCRDCQARRARERQRPTRPSRSARGARDTGRSR